MSDHAKLGLAVLLLLASCAPVAGAPSRARVDTPWCTADGVQTVGLCLYGDRIGVVSNHAVSHPDCEPCVVVAWEWRRCSIDYEGAEGLRTTASVYMRANRGSVDLFSRSLEAR